MTLTLTQGALVLPKRLTALVIPVVLVPLPLVIVEELSIHQSDDPNKEIAMPFLASRELRVGEDLRELDWLWSRVIVEAGPRQHVERSPKPFGLRQDHGLVVERLDLHTVLLDLTKPLKVLSLARVDEPELQGVD